LNGEVVARAASVSVAATLNAAATDGVWRMFRGQAEGGMPLLRSIFDNTRAAMGAS
jgi:hypothetical protein